MTSVKEKERLKIAHITLHKGSTPAISFNNLAATKVPLSVLKGVSCYLNPDVGAPQQSPTWDPPDSGIVASELKKWDSIHLDCEKPEEFYFDLYCEGLKQPGLILYIDRDLETAFKLRLEPLSANL